MIRVKTEYLFAVFGINRKDHMGATITLLSYLDKGHNNRTRNEEDGLISPSYYSHSYLVLKANTPGIRLPKVSSRKVSTTSSNAKAI